MTGDRHRGQAVSGQLRRRPPPWRRSLAVGLAFALAAAGTGASELVNLHARDRTGRLLAVALGSGPAPSPGMAGTVRILRQTCDFRTGASPRNGWDLPLRADLRRSRGLQFHFRCADTTPVSYFALYLQSGNGWYRFEFAPRGNGRWETIILDKRDSQVEGTPAGWGRIECLRVSAWRRSGGKTAFDCAAFTARPATGAILVVRGLGNAGLPAAEIKAAVRHAADIDRLLADHGIGATLVDEPDVDGAMLAGAPAVILPYNPAATNTLAATLASYLERGGHITGFYTLPERLQAATGIRKTAYRRAADIPGGLAAIRPAGDILPGAPARVEQRSWNLNVFAPEPSARVAATWLNDAGQDTGCPAVLVSRRAAWMSHVLLNTDDDQGGRLLLAMLATGVPTVWRDAAGHRLAGLGRALRLGSVADAIRLIGAQAPPGSPAAAALVQAQATQDAATRALRAGAFAEALTLADACDDRLLDAYCRVQRPLAGEFRAVWCHRGQGIDGWTWERSISQLRGCGFNTVLPFVASGSTAAYRSTVLQPLPGVGAENDPLRECVTACRRQGVRCHAWISCLRLGDNPPPDTLQRLRQAGRLQVAFDGTPLPEWLCPAHPANRQQVLKVVREIARRYAVAGIHLDYIRFPNGEGCFCPTCHAAFEERIGRKVGTWPADVRNDARLRQPWQEFRADLITSLVRAVRAELVAAPRRTQLSAAVFADSASARRTVGQDWPAWAADELVDFVCPMDYTADDAAFRTMVRTQLETAARPRIPLYPGIGMSKERLDAAGVIRQVNAARQAGARGFVLFEYDREEAVSILPRLATGLTAPAR